MKGWEEAAEYKMSTWEELYKIGRKLGVNYRI